MPELVAILKAKRDVDHRQNKFLAAIQGVDLESDSKSSSGQKAWEDIKSRVFSGGQAKDSDDILSLQGINATQAGFGIGAGLEYADLKGEEPKNPFG